MEEGCRGIESLCDSGGRAGLTERLLLESEEDGVYELDVLEVVVDHIVEFQFLRVTVASARGGARLRAS